MWRVTLKSIHPGEVRVIPRREVNKLEEMIQLYVQTGPILSYELDKRVMKQLSEELKGQATE